MILIVIKIMLITNRNHIHIEIDSFAMHPSKIFRLVLFSFFVRKIFFHVVLVRWTSHATTTYGYEAQARPTHYLTTTHSYLLRRLSLNRLLLPPQRGGARHALVEVAGDGLELVALLGLEPVQCVVDGLELEISRLDKFNVQGREEQKFHGWY